MSYVLCLQPLLLGGHILESPEHLEEQTYCLVQFDYPNIRLPNVSYDVNKKYTLLFYASAIVTTGVKGDMAGPWE